MNQLLRLDFGARGHSDAASFMQLMQASEDRLAALAREGSPQEMQLCSEILASPNEYQLWAAEHTMAMQKVALETRAGLQLRALLSAAVGMIHRTAPFEFLRRRKLPAADRRRLLRALYGERQYTATMVAEHGNYRRGSVSLMCARYLCGAVYRNSLSRQRLNIYRQIYDEYYSCYCDTALTDEPGVQLRTTLPKLKRAVHEAHNTLLNGKEK